MVDSPKQNEVIGLERTRLVVKLDDSRISSEDTFLASSDKLARFEGCRHAPGFCFSRSDRFLTDR